MRLNAFIKNYLAGSRVLLAIVLMIVIGGAYYTTKLTVFYDLQAFFPQNDPDLDFYQAHLERFEEDDNFIYLAIRSEKTIFDSTFLHRFDRLTNDLSKLPNLVNTSSLSNLKEPVFTPLGGALQIPVIHTRQTDKYVSDSIKIFKDIRLINRYISADAKTVTILMKHESEMLEADLQVLVQKVEETTQAHGWKDYKIVGRAKSITSIVSAIGQEFAFYIMISACLAMIVMIFFLRRFWGVVITIGLILMCLLVFLGFLGLTGKPLDVMSPLFPTLILVVGMSDIIHLLSKYVDELNKGRDRETALVITAKEIGLATLLTSVTTSIGFLSLCTSNLNAIISFGAYAAVGVLLTYILVMAFIIAVITRIPPDRLMNRQKHSELWNNLMEKCYDLTLAFPKTILGISLLIFLGSLWGISQISTNVYLLGDVPKTSRLREDFTFFEKELSGVRVFEMAVMAKGDYRINDWVILQELEKLEVYLATIPEIGYPLSPLTLYKTLHKAHNGNLQDYFKLPEKASAIKKYDRKIKQANAKELDLLISEDGKYARMNANMQDLGSDQIHQLNRSVEKWIANNIDHDKVEFRLTGTGLMVDKNHEQLRQNLLYGLGLAFLCVSIIMMLLFKDVKMAFIALIPNIFPLLIAGGIMGWVGISLKASTSIIFTIAFGIAVDDTIHFLGKFNLQRRKGMKLEQAIKTTFLETGKAIFLTTVILFAGFFILVSSAFNATYYLGLLVSLTLVNALVADLFLLPVVLRMCIKD